MNLALKQCKFHDLVMKYLSDVIIFIATLYIMRYNVIITSAVSFTFYYYIIL